jgi:hypothetical protein
MVEHRLPRSSATLFCLFLGLVVFIARCFTSSSPYYVDSPAHVAAILNHTYVIQPPGYWLFNRLGGLFPNPARTLSVLNWSFSALGTMALYGCARRLVSSPFAELGAVFYAVVFFAWFSADIQSTYASQLLFAPLTFWLMLRGRDTGELGWIIGAGVSFSLGAGLRPSDGVFLLPLLILFAFSFGIRDRLILLALVVALCCAWLVPSEIALHQYDTRTTAGQLSSVARGAILFGRINIYSASNVFRVAMTLALALGPSAPFILNARGSSVRWLWVWVLPALAFYFLVYMSDALYLDCILGGLILLALTGMNASRYPRIAIACLVSSIVLNTVFFVGFSPLASQSVGARIVNKYYGNFSLYGLRHHYWIPHLF